jgi:hypothetical protein
MFSFFLDGRVKHGHDEECFSPRFRFFHTLPRGNDTAESPAAPSGASAQPERKPVRLMRGKAMRAVPRRASWARTGTQNTKSIGLYWSGE